MLLHSPSYSCNQNVPASTGIKYYHPVNSAQVIILLHTASLKTHLLASSKQCILTYCCIYMYLHVALQYMYIHGKYVYSTL